MREAETVPGLKPQGIRKYGGSRLLLSSIDRGWPNIGVELRSHEIGGAAIITPEQMEITVAVKGNAGARVSRSGAGERQDTIARNGAIWLSPVDVGDNEIDVLGHLPQILHLYLSPQRLIDLADDYSLPRDPSRSIRYVAGVRDEVITQLGLALVAELEEETWAGTMFAETTCLALSSRLIQNYADYGEWRSLERSKRLDLDRIGRVIDYIEANLDRQIRLSELAAIACLSVYHFCRMFKAVTGEPPTRYLSLKRLQRAKELLAKTDLDLVEIALASQFSSQAAFTKAFRRVVGVTPGEFRRSLT